MSMIVDRNGSAHHAAGAPASQGGKFAAKRSGRQQSTLTADVHDPVEAFQEAFARARSGDENARREAALNLDTHLNQVLAAADTSYSGTPQVTADGGLELVGQEHSGRTIAVTFRRDAHEVRWTASERGRNPRDVVPADELAKGTREAIAELVHDPLVRDWLGAGPHPSELYSQHIGHTLDSSACDAIYAVGESVAAREELAKTTQDPAILGQLAWDHIAEVSLNVARNPHAPASALYHLATTNDRAAGFEVRLHALLHENTAPATFREVWGRQVELEAYGLFAHADRMPAIPGDVLAMAYSRGHRNAVRHPRFPAEQLQYALEDPDQVLDAVRNPTVTAAQLDAVLELDFAGFYDTTGGEFENAAEHAAIVAHEVAVHPNVSKATVERLAQHPDPITSRTARNRLRSFG